MKNFFDTLSKLWGPLADSIKGKLSSREFALAIVIAAIFALLGGNLANLSDYLLRDINTHTDNNVILSGLVALLVSLLHRSQQGQPK
jgi:hypothetical protein